MRVMVMVKATPGSEAGEMPTQELMAEMGRYNEELVKAGIMKSGDGLRPSKDAIRVHFSGKNRTVIDGPFAETKELVAGYWLWEVKDMQEAVEWVKRCPNPMMEDSDIDIRPFYEMEDFAEWDPSGKFLAEEEELRKRLIAQQATVQPYLFYNGRCEEALNHYKQAIGAEIGMVMRFSDAPDPVPEGMLQPGFENKIMHSEFTIGKLTLMASDGCNDTGKPDGYSLALTVHTKEDADRIYNALAEGGQTTMPLGKTFWSPYYGIVTDKFGVSWMVMLP